MAKARAIANLSPEDAYGVAATKILVVRSEELVEHSRGVLDMDDIEPVHAMRVATRRLRAALEIFEPCFPAKAHKAVLAEVKELADALGERRDRDVAVESLEAFAEKLPAPDRRGVASLVDALRLEQARANEALRPYAEPGRAEGVRDRVRELVAEPGTEAEPAPLDPVDAQVLARASAGNGAGGAA